MPECECKRNKTGRNYIQVVMGAINWQINDVILRDKWWQVHVIEFVSLWPIFIFTYTECREVLIEIPY